MEIYLAARYTRRTELVCCRADLLAVGYTVTSRWLAGEGDATNDGVAPEGTEEERQRWALIDWEDIKAAGVMINFTEPPGSTHSRGGRHVEFGMALFRGKRPIVVGPRENVFHCLPGVEVYETWAECLTQLVRER